MPKPPYNELAAPGKAHLKLLQLLRVAHSPVERFAEPDMECSRFLAMPHAHLLSPLMAWAHCPVGRQAVQKGGRSQLPEEA